jgi:glycosyltransferase involved in cell wall biosynthesis
MRVSTIVAVYNGADRLGAALDSILAQDLAPFEIIVVDDGSTDTTQDVIRSYGKAVRAFHQPNAGLSAAHNHGLREASGDAIAFLDHDDLWPPNRLSAMARLMQSDEGIDIVAGQVEIVVEGAAMTATPERYATTHRPWSVQSLLVRRHVFDRVGLFDLQLKYGMDIDWYMRAREAAIRYEFVPEISLIWRMHSSNMTRDLPAMFGGTLTAFKGAIDRRRRKSP